MALADSLTPKTVQEADAERMGLQLKQGAIQQQQFAAQNAQEEMQNKRRAMAVSMLNGIANEQDPAKQAALYATLKPMAERYDTTLKLPEEYDPTLSKALMYSQMSPREVLSTAQPKLPQGYRMNPETGEAELIPGIDPSFAKRGDPFGMMPVFNPTTGQMEFVPKSAIAGGGYQPPGAAPNETQKTTAGYATRMAEQARQMNDLENAGVNSADTWENVKERVPFVGNYLIDDQFQSLRQAQNDWIRAKLRKESGAVIADSEMESERRTYFPMPGDEPETIRKKALSRATAEKAMTEAAGTAMRPTGPKPGAVVNGFVFMGGDPNDQKSWKPQR